jgi:putative ABC transport system permease protein
MGDGNPPREYEVVGIVEDVKHMGLIDEPMPTLYGAMPQAPKSAVPFMANNLSLVVRTGIEPEVLVSTVRKELRNVDVDVATAGVRPMHQFLSAAVAARRFNMELIGVFAATALLLAAAGLYAVIAYLVSQRTREIGIRLALGATPRHILRLMMTQGLRLTLIGVAIGFIGAIAVTRLMRSLLFSVAPTDLMTFAISCVVLIVVALLACFIPARRATKVDPLVALRYE